MFVALISWRASKIIDQMVFQLVSAYHSTIEGWAQALEMRNQETEGHSHRVVDLTMKLAENMRMPAAAVSTCNAGYFYMISAKWEYRILSCANTVR